MCNVSEEEKHPINQLKQSPTANLAYISPFFIVANLKASLAFYADKLGFEVRYLSPGDDPFFAIVGRDGVSIMLKGNAADKAPAPNWAHHQWARWDAYISTDNPDELYEEFCLKEVSFQQPLRNDSDGLRGFEVRDADGYVLFFGRPE